MFEIVRSIQESDRTTDFVAIGNLVSDDFKSYHCSFIINLKGRLLEFHYTGRNIEFSELENEYYHKISDTIISEEVPAFVAYCKSILKHANPQYGFFYSGEYYDKDGIHFGSQELGERMTCVGFCLNVLKGFLEDDYLDYSGWTEDSHDDSGYLDKFCLENGIEPAMVKEYHRRISPRECLTSCFFTHLPISKSDIDIKIVSVNDYFNILFQSSSN